MLKTGTAKFGIKELIKVVTPTVYIATHKNIRNTSKTSLLIL